MFENQPANPQMELLLPEAGRTLNRWISYKFNNHFLTPADGFSLQIESADLDPITEDAIVPGATVQLRVGDYIQATGYIDSIERSANRERGTVWQIEGRDVLGQAVDAGIDPRAQFTATMSLEDMLLKVFAPFGWGREQLFITDPSADAEARTGRRVKRRRGESLKRHKLAALRPNPNEGAFEFAARVAARCGLQIWPTADGRSLVVAKPTFDQAPSYRLIRRRTGNANNVLDGTAKFDSSEQPSMIIADGYSGGGTFGKSKIRVLAMNPAVHTDGDEIPAIVQANKNAKLLVLGTASGEGFYYAPMRNPRARPLYLHDEDSKTLEQLENFTRREMMKRVRKSLTCSYSVAGHGQIRDDGALIPWDVDSVVDVQDDVTGVHEPMWILSRTFNKSSSGGTTTELELIRLYSLEI